jgi:hypothetical protein
MYNFICWGWAALDVVSFSTFWQTLPLPSSGRTCVGGFREPCVEHAVSGEWDVRDLIGGSEERPAI